MKINKLLCDKCEKIIEKDSDMRSGGNCGGSIYGVVSKKAEFVNLDVCGECLEKVINFIKNDSR